ncbi:hypothetical protein [Halobacillus sp. Nhm2S1]|uniref:hypothetical protein n=1 Tax=Halobacillus sp. Nhm2S1 TaxID=2866716 RepID=UPI001C730880|nr:hypothetical protein [Halobacillus sp. Nhm2S1]MBX0358205.1 hypothetical protein [Halobacillus sp. Nhm2S1]
MSTQWKKKKDIARFIFLLVIITISPLLNKSFDWFVNLAIVFFLYFVLMFLMNCLIQETNEH